MLTCTVVAGLMILTWGEEGRLQALPRDGGFILMAGDDHTVVSLGIIGTPEFPIPFLRTVVAEAILDCD